MLAFHSLLRWKMIILPFLTISPMRFSFRRLGECTFWAVDLIYFFSRFVGKADRPGEHGRSVHGAERGTGAVLCRAGSRNILAQEGQRKNEETHPEFADQKVTHRKEIESGIRVRGRQTRTHRKERRPGEREGDLGEAVGLGRGKGKEATLLRVQEMFPKIFRNIFCVQDTTYVSAANVARATKRVKIWETWSRQHVAATMCPHFAGALRPVYTCDFWCDFAYKTRLTLPCTNVYFAKHLVDWKERYHILFEDTLLSNFCQLGGILSRRYATIDPCGVGWGRFCAQNRIKIAPESHRKSHV